MSTVELVRELRNAGASIRARGDKVRIEAPRGVLTPERRDQLAARKAELLACLNRRERVAFNLAEQPDCWPVCIGGPGETVDEVTATLYRRYGDRLVATKAWESA